MNQEEQIELAISNLLSYCCDIENKYEGFTAFAYQSPIKKLEEKCDRYWKEKNYNSFMLAFNNLKGEWEFAANRFTQRKLF